MTNLILALSSRQSCQRLTFYQFSCWHVRRDNVVSGQALGEIPERVIGLAKIPSFSEPVSMARGMESPSLAGLEPCAPSVSNGWPNIPRPQTSTVSISTTYLQTFALFPRVSWLFRLNGKAQTFYHSILYSPDHLLCGRH